MKITSTILRQAAQRATGWLASQQTEQGNYRGLKEPDANGIYPDTDDVGCYYKSVYSLRVAGHGDAAARLMRHIVDRYMRESGDIYTNAQSRSSGSYGPVFCHLYQNSWLARAAAAMRWYGLGKRIVDFMVSMRDPKTGGFHAHVNPPSDIIDSCITAVGALACLQHQRPQLAVESVDFLLEMLAAQGEPGKLYVRWTTEGGLLKDLSGIEEKNYKYCYIDQRAGKQAYWLWAWPMNVMLAVYEFTGQDKYLQGGIAIWEWLAGGHEDAFHFTTAGKGGWGSAMLYRITGDKRYLDKCLSQMEFILECSSRPAGCLGPARPTSPPSRCGQRMISQPTSAAG